MCEKHVLPSEADMLARPNLINEYLINANDNVNHIMDFDLVTVVMGNESCDLDSAVSSLVYGLCQYNVQKSKKKNTAVITVFNILPSEMRLKTEVIFWLKRWEVNMDLIVFRNQLDLEVLLKEGKLKLILLDHHVFRPSQMYLMPSVVEVIDHRPVERNVTWPNAKVTIELVGSCATLIARELEDNYKDMLTQQVSLLLYGAIILDTAGLSDTSGRTKPLDVSVANHMECMYKECNRVDVLRDLSEARANVESLTAGDLLDKDVKIVCRIPICGFPILIKKFVEKPDAAEALTRCCLSQKTNLVILMGQEIASGNFVRDLAIYSFASGLGQKLIEYLQASQDPDLLLKEDCLDKVHQICGLRYFTQGNTKASRKQVLPLVQAALQNVPELAELRVPYEIGFGRFVWEQIVHGEYEDFVIPRNTDVWDKYIF